MKDYEKIDVKELELEDLVRWNSHLIEDGLKYVDHQKFTSGGRLDILLVDTDKSLVVAELKVNEDDDMLMQAVDYYDYVSNHVDAFARLYHSHDIDPKEQIRLILIAPSFSQELVNRCKWLKIPISLFTFICLKFEGDEGIVPVFTEQEIPVPPPPPDTTTIEDLLKRIIDPDVSKNVVSLLEEIKNWKPSQIAIDPVKSGISMKIRGRVFAYLFPRRKHFIIGTFDKDDVWDEYPVHEEGDLESVKILMREAIERKISDVKT